jgi:hypothetical protein
MSKLYLLAATNEKDRMEGSINSVLAIGADEAAARAAALTAKPNGSFDASKFAEWSAWLVADGTITLPVTGAVQFMGNAYGVNPLPGN